jgi:hypothetical protein
MFTLNTQHSPFDLGATSGDRISGWALAFAGRGDIDHDDAYLLS